jgi:predicted TIM-barrel enzyme
VKPTVIPFWQETYPKFLPVIHVQGPAVTPESFDRALAIAKDNLMLSMEAGADGAFFIDQTIGESCLMRLVGRVREDERFAKFPIGINLLSLMPEHMMRLAYNADLQMVWADDADPAGLARRGLERGAFTGPYFGGVGFKYKRALPYEQVAPAIASCGDHVQFITTSGPATGSPPEKSKLQLYADCLLPGQKLAIASGVTVENVEHLVLDVQRKDSLLVHAVLVASGIEDSFGRLNAKKTKEMGHTFQQIRGG